MPRPSSLPMARACEKVVTSVRLMRGCGRRRAKIVRRMRFRRNQYSVRSRPRRTCLVRRRPSGARSRGTRPAERRICEGEAQPRPGSLRLSWGY